MCLHTNSSIQPLKSGAQKKTAIWKHTPKFKPQSRQKKKKSWTARHQWLTPSYSGGRDQEEDHSSKPAWGNGSETLSQEHPTQKRLLVECLPSKREAPSSNPSPTKKKKKKKTGHKKQAKSVEAKEACSQKPIPPVNPS
jgi:hypothetical protein